VHTHTDEQIMQLITRRAETDECRDGFLLVNFPRRPGQMAALEEWLQEADENVSTVVYLDVPEEVIIERVSNRLVHSASGRTYHTKLHPPKVLKPIPLDDETGEPLDRRPVSFFWTPIRGLIESPCAGRCGHASHWAAVPRSSVRVA
jgi:adenylate kinase